MKILIIGANGFLGRHIAQAALAKSWNVWCMYRTNREYIGRCKTISISALANVRDTFDAVFLSVGNHTMELIDLFESNLQKHIPHTKILTRPGAVLPSCRFNPKYTMTTLRWKPQIELEMYLKELIASYAG